MGLLYVNGERFHDDDAELIERARRPKSALGPSAKVCTRGDVEHEFFTQREVLQSLSAEVRAAARARRDDTPH